MEVNLFCTVLQLKLSQSSDWPIILQVASVVRNQMTSEQQFNIWVWDLALRLHLHKMSLPSPVLLLDIQAAQEREAIPDVENDVSMLPLLKSIKAENSMACFVALAMTKYGHR